MGALHHRLAAQAPWWEPGTGSGYHAVTQGYLIGEIVRRITGDTIGASFAREVAKPLEADFYIGLPASEDRRVSNVIPPPPIDLNAMEGEVTDLMLKTFLNPPVDASMAHHEWWRGERSPPPTARATPARSPPSSRSSRGGVKGERCAPALGRGHGPDLRGAGRRHRQGARRTRAHGHGLRTQQSTRDAARPTALVTGAATAGPSSSSTRTRSSSSATS